MKVMSDNRMSIAKGVIIFLLLIGGTPEALNADESHPTQAVTVLRVNNGQEVLVELNGEGRAVRLACIQAPLFQQQPWANEAKTALSKELPEGSIVLMELRARDVYGRIVARLINDKKDVTAPLVSEGHVFAYDGYLGRCDDLNYQNLETTAKQFKAGIWAIEGGIERPWDLIEASDQQQEP